MTTTAKIPQELTAAAMKEAEGLRQRKIREIGKPSAEPDVTKWKDNSSLVFDENKLTEYRVAWMAHVSQWKAWLVTQNVSAPPGQIVDEYVSLARSWKKGNVVYFKPFNLRLFYMYRERGIPERLMLVKFKDWIPRSDADKETLQTACDMAHKRSGLILFTGPVGTGKSHLSVCIAKRQREFWMIEHQVLWGIRKKSFEGKKEDPSDKAKSVHCLVLDELELPGGRDEILFIRGIIKSRLDRGRLTVITTNLPFGRSTESDEAETAGEIRTLRQLLGARIVDRLKEPGNFVKGIKGASHR